MILFLNRGQCDNQFTVVVTPPKTASGTLHDAYTGRCNSRWVIGPQRFDHESLTHHTTLVPGWVIDGPYRVLMTVRHPFQRAISLWRHLFERDRVEIEFERFVDDYLLRASCHWFYHWSLADYQDQIETIETRTRLTVDDFIRFELLNTDCRQKLFPVELPHETKAARGIAWEDIVTPDIEAKLRHWAGHDLTRYGYG